MKLLIDADGCPVVELAVQAARKHELECLIFCDTSHEIQKSGATTITVSKGADSADFALLQRVCPGDIVVTQDYGLAALCLSRVAVPISQDGMEYTPENIDGLLLARHTSQRIRRGGGRLRGPKKRMQEQNLAFQQKLAELIQSGRQKERGSQGTQG